MFQMMQQDECPAHRVRSSRLRVRARFLLPLPILGLRTLRFRFARRQCFEVIPEIALRHAALEQIPILLLQNSELVDPLLQREALKRRDAYCPIKPVRRLATPEVKIPTALPKRSVKAVPLQLGVDGFPRHTHEGYYRASPRTVCVISLAEWHPLSFQLIRTIQLDSTGPSSRRAADSRRVRVLAAISGELSQLRGALTKGGGGPALWQADCS